MSSTTEKIAWLRKLGVDLPAPDLTDGGGPATTDFVESLHASAEGLLAGLDGGINFDLKPSGSPSDAKKLEADAKKIEAAANDWKDRLAKITLTYETAATAEAYNKAAKAFVTALQAGVAKKDLADAVKAMAGVEKALKALEARTKALDLPKKQKDATDTGDKIDKMSDADVAKLKPEDKAKLVKAMLGAGKPTGKVRDAQKKIYRNTDVDADYRKDDEARQDKVTAALKGDKDLAEARGKWDKLDKEGLRKALGKIVAVQSKAYGISPPSIVFFPDEEPAVTKGAGVVLGYFNPADGKLHINRDPAAGIKDFTTTIETVLHENMHHYQTELVKLLAAGKLKSSDPRYKQALMFQVNGLEPGGYVDPDEGVTDYQKQPLERSAEETGTKTAGKIATAVKPPAKAP
jgi:hypothetical protein